MVHLRRTLANTAIISLIATLTWVSADAGSQHIPVMVGGSSDFDACGGTGQVAELDPNGDYYLSVRTGPGTKYNEIDRLPMGAVVFLCDERSSWYGIVYPDGDCGVMTPVFPRQPYEGVCRSGWVYKKYISIVTG